MQETRDSAYFHGFRFDPYWNRAFRGIQNIERGRRPYPSLDPFWKLMGAQRRRAIRVGAQAGKLCCGSPVTLLPMDPGTQLLASMLVGTLGLALLVYGKKQSRFPQMLVGLLMMVFPYFMPDALYTGIVAAILTALLILVVRLGF
jgi:hypothetical protein